MYLCFCDIALEFGLWSAKSYFHSTAYSFLMISLFKEKYLLCIVSPVL